MLVYYLAYFGVWETIEGHKVGEGGWGVIKRNTKEETRNKMEYGEDAWCRLEPQNADS